MIAVRIIDLSVNCFLHICWNGLPNGDILNLENWYILFCASNGILENLFKIYFDFLQVIVQAKWNDFIPMVDLDCDFVDKSAIFLNQITENEPFENCVFKKLHFENAKNCFFKS